jgi:hypothetical protein
MQRAALKAEVKIVLPACPGFYVDEIVERLSARPIIAQRLKIDIISMAQSVIRHQLTEYDALRTRHELTPEEARLIVQPEIEDWFGQWIKAAT